MHLRLHSLLSCGRGLSSLLDGLLNVRRRRLDRGRGLGHGRLVVLDVLPPPRHGGRLLDDLPVEVDYLLLLLGTALAVRVPG